MSREGGWPLRACKEVRLLLRTVESEIKFGFLKDLPTAVKGVGFGGGGRQVGSHCNSSCKNNHLLVHLGIGGDCKS